MCSELRLFRRSSAIRLFPIQFYSTHFQESLSRNNDKMDPTVNETENLEALLGALSEIDEPVHWDDNYFKTNFMEKNKVAGRLPYNQTKEYAKAFLNWYLSGKGGGKLLDIWICLVGGMMVPTSSISHEKLLVDLMFNGKIGENETIKLEPLLPVSKLTDFIYANEGNSFNSIEAMTWYNRVYDMLDSDFSSGNAVPAPLVSAINYLSYIALSLLKLLVKDATKISQYITKNITNEFNEFWQSNNRSIRMRTPPPHKFAINQFENIFEKTSKSGIKALTFVVATYVYTDSIYKDNVRKVLKTACLDYIDLYGMGCLYWLQKAQKSCSTTPEVLLDCMRTVQNQRTNDALHRVLKYYADPNLNQHTWRWSRLFVDNAFKNISTSKNRQYAATLAALSCKCDSDNPIWKISQFRDESLKNEAINKARSILNALNNVLTRRLLETNN